jgi:hypothetical protein
MLLLLLLLLLVPLPLPLLDVANRGSSRANPTLFARQPHGSTTDLEISTAWTLLLLLLLRLLLLLVAIVYCCCCCCCCFCPPFALVEIGQSPPCPLLLLDRLVVSFIHSRRYSASTVLYSTLPCFALPCLILSCLPRKLCCCMQILQHEGGIVMGYPSRHNSAC